MTSNRVLVLTSDTGSGHRSVSRALVAGASGAPDRGIELIEFDPLVSGDPLLAQERSGGGVRPALMDRVVGLYGAVIVRAPWTWGLAFHLAGLPGMRSIYHALHGRTVTSRIRAAIRATRAQAVVSVHPLVNDAMVARETPRVEICPCSPLSPTWWMSTRGGRMAPLTAMSSALGMRTCADWSGE